MTWSFVFFCNSVLLGVGLAMDAFSVSMANGLNEAGMRVRRHSRCICRFPGIDAVGRMVLCLSDRPVFSGV